MDVTRETVLLDVKKLIVTNQPIEPLPPQEIENLKKSIEEVGLLYPLLVKPIGRDKFEVLDGRTRLEILKELGYSMIKCEIVEGFSGVTEMIPYDAEIFRRHLNERQKKHYLKIRNDFKEKILADHLNNLIESCPPDIAKKLKHYIERIDDDVNDVIEFLQSFSNLSEPLQRNFLEVLSRNEDIERRLMELEEEKEELESELERLRKTMKDSAVESLKAKVEKRLKEKEKELEERYRQMTLEEKEKLLEQERARIRKELETELKDREKTLERMKKNYTELMKRHEQTKDEIESLKRQRKDAEEVAEKYRRDLRYYREVVERVTGAEKIEKKLRGVLEECEAIRMLIIERRYVLDEFGEERKNSFFKVIDSTQRVLSEIKEFVKQIH